MTSHPKTDANLTESERIAISTEARISSLTAAVYFLITAVLVGGGLLAALAFPGDIRAEVQTLDAGTRELIGWSLYAPLATTALGGYYLFVAQSVRGRLIQKPVFRA